MIRPVVIVVALAVAVGALEVAGERRQSVARNAERAIYAQACEYYRSRAGIEPAQRAAGGFVVFLAGTCGAAEISLDSGTRKQRARSALLLSRIALLRETVGRMNAERAARAVARADVNGGAGPPTMVPVTPTGEFLIAHRMGLMIAIDAWLDTGVDFSLAFSW
ncbi:MAG: hypothetical protein ACTSVG_09900 [Alphaproteobacteria bacterium]